MSVCFDFCVFSNRGLCVGLIKLPSVFLFLSGFFFLRVEKGLQFDGLIPIVADQSTREKVKVRCSRYRPGVTQRVGRGIAILFHDRGTRRG